MTIDESDIEAEVYTHDTDKNRFFVKVSFAGLGMYINSFAVLPSKFENQGYWLQPPSRYNGAKWKEIVEFDKNHYPAWNIIENKCLQAVKDFLGEEARLKTLKSDNASLDDTLDFDDNEPVNLNDLPF